MDISYLLFLQDFRIAINDALTPFLEGVSYFAMRQILFLPAIVYWLISKRKGLFVQASLSISLWINAIIKLTVCAYRPWVRDARIIPAGNYIDTAGGYSFPSGHTMTAAPIFASLAVLARKKIYAFIAFILILLVMFSRNYLGVHTLQDVVVGLIMGTFAVYITAKIFAYLDKNPEKENLFMLAALIIYVAGICYTFFKSYPMDYVNGKLLVNPQKEIIPSLGDMSILFGLVAGRYIDKKFIKFRPAGINLKGIILCAIGLYGFWLVMTQLRGVISPYVGSTLARAIGGFMKSFYIVAVWPLVMKIFEVKNK